jgi:predicted nuclease with TOPRIM domain
MSERTDLFSSILQSLQSGFERICDHLEQMDAENKRAHEAYIQLWEMHCQLHDKYKELLTRTESNSNMQ